MNYKDSIAFFYLFVNYLYRLVYTNIVLFNISQKLFILSPIYFIYTQSYPQLYTLVYTIVLVFFSWIVLLPFVTKSFRADVFCLELPTTQVTFAANRQSSAAANSTTLHRASSAKIHMLGLDNRWPTFNSEHMWYDMYLPQWNVSLLATIRLLPIGC